MKLVRALVCASVGLAALAPSALASSLCDAASTSPIFSTSNDFGQYKPFPGATFENGASGWSWGNKANIVSGDDNGLVAGGSHAVNIPGGGTAKSPWVCVDATMPSMRFFVRRVSGTGNLTVQGHLETKSGKQYTTFATISPTTAWQPSPIVVFPSQITTAVMSDSVDAQFLFVADPGTTFRIDGVYMDPFKRI